MVDWISILERECASSNNAEVGRRIGYSRTAVSLALKGAYRGSTDKLAKAVIETFSECVHCPFLNGAISKQECTEFHSIPIPQSNAAALRHWRACQACENSVQTSEVSEDA